MKMRSSLLYILTALLSVFSIHVSHAQAVQDALYIYRNDGQFNAFFFGDIERIEYSKIDTLGVEQDDYVVQEVYALDSLIRIPLNAIDSVAFVTPETKVKADVFCPDKSIANYIVASDSVYWIRLAKDTPASLIPKVGDKLLIEDESPFIPDGFGGLVTSVDEGADGFTVMTSALALTDIYEQLVIKVAGATPDMEPIEARRRGLIDGVSIVVPEMQITIPTVSQSLSLKNSTALLPDNSYVELNGDVQGSFSTSVATKLRLRAFLTITPDVFCYNQMTYIVTETETAATLSGGLSGRLEVPFLPSPTHTFKLGMLKFELGLGLFLEAQATALSLGFKNSRVQETRVNITMDQNDVDLSIFGTPEFHPYYRWSSNVSKNETKWEFNSTGQYTLGFGAFAKAEAKFTVPVEKLPKFVQAWVDGEKKFGFKATLGVDAGMKTEYTGPLTSAAPELIDTQPFYKELNKANISESLYLKFVAALNCGNWTPEYSPEVKLWEPINRGLVPDITGISVEQDAEQPIRPYRMLFKSPTTDKKILTGMKIGFAVFDADNKLVTDTLNAFYWISSDVEKWKWNGKENSNECVLKLDPGKGEDVTYTAYPMIQFMDTKVLVDQKHEFTLDAARIDIADREINVDESSGYREIEVVPNMANMEVKPEADWLKQTTPSWLDHLNELTIYWPSLPNGVNDRRGVVRLIGKSQKGEVLTEDSIVVYQSRGTEPPPTPTNDPSRWIIGTWHLQHNSYGYLLIFGDVDPDKSIVGQVGSYECYPLDRYGNKEKKQVYNAETNEWVTTDQDVVDIGTYYITSWERKTNNAEDREWVEGMIHVDYTDSDGKSYSIDDDFTVRPAYLDPTYSYELEFGFGGRHTRWFSKY